MYFATYGFAIKVLSAYCSSIYLNQIIKIYLDDTIICNYMP